MKMSQVTTNEFVLPISAGLVDHIIPLGKSGFCIYFRLLCDALKNYIQHRHRRLGAHQRGEVHYFLSELAPLVDLTLRGLQYNLEREIWDHYIEFDPGTKAKRGRFIIKNFKTLESFQVINRQYPITAGEPPAPVVKPEPVPSIRPFFGVEDTSPVAPSPGLLSKHERARLYAEICQRHFHLYQDRGMQEDQFERDVSWYENRFNEGEWKNLNMEIELDSWDARLTIARRRSPGGGITQGTINSLRAHLRWAVRDLKREQEYGKNGSSQRSIDEVAAELADF